MSRWSRPEERARASERAREQRLAEHERLVDPDDVLPPDVRAELARTSLQAAMLRLVSARERKRGRL